jgi:hypothetical protein
VAFPPQRPGQKGNPGANGAGDPVDERHQTEQLSELCRELEEDVERLRARYEMYFLGVEKREPNRDRDEIKRRVERIKSAFTRNTGLKFRIQTLAARFLSYERMWLRSAREKEDGTYRRDLLRARRHAQEKRQAPHGDDGAPSAGEPARTPEAGEAPAAQGAAPEAAEVPAGPDPGVEPPARPMPTAPRAPPPPPAAPGVGDEQMRALFDAYVAAKKRCNEDVSRLSYDAVSRSVQRQVPELLARFKAKTVEFKVVIQGGKAVLKAVPKL